MKKILALMVWAGLTLSLFAQEPQVFIEGMASIDTLEAEGFEGGLGNFSNTGNVNWTTTNIEAYTGSFSATSNIVENTEEATLSLSVNIPIGFTAILQFFTKADITHNSGPNKQNGRVAFKMSGVTEFIFADSFDWIQKVYFLTEGSHTLEWTAFHLSGGSKDDVQMYLDDVLIFYNKTPSLRITDGTEGMGKVLVSDAYGNAGWISLSAITEFDNTSGNALLPLMLDGNHQVTNTLTVKNANSIGIYTTSNSGSGMQTESNGLHGLTSSLNAASGILAENNTVAGMEANQNPIGYKAENNTLDGFSALNNGRNGFRSENNTQAGFFAMSNAYGFVAHTHLNDGFRATNNTNHGFLADSNSVNGFQASFNSNGFVAFDNASDGFVAELNTNNGFLSNFNSVGFEARSNSGNGFLANFNTDDGFRAVQNFNFGFCADDNSNGFLADMNNTDGYIANQNGRYGFVANLSGDDGFFAIDNANDGFQATSNDKDGIFSFFNDGDEGYFDGTVEVTGQLSKGSGSFKIDHPLDPENKFLYHSFVESPDMMNIYNGNVILDQNGEAVVEMEPWFQPLNRDFRYQLTAIGAPGPTLYIAEEVNENRFKIAGGTPGMKVSWQVTGIRQDPYADQNRIQVEVEKPEKFKGYYIHPEAYGHPFAKGFSFVKLGHKTIEELQEEMQSDREIRKSAK